MKKAKSLLSAVIAFALIISTLFATNLTAFAATSSSGTSTRTISVTTKSNYLIPGAESITISQSKGTCVNKTYNIFTGKTTQKTSKIYGEWDITVESTDGKHKYSQTLTGSSIKLKLKPNKTYNITISWDSQAAFFKTVGKGDFTSYPTWKVKSTWKVSSYS